MLCCVGVLEQSELAKGAMGQRVLHDITLETYTPKGEHTISIFIVLYVHTLLKHVSA